MQEVIWNGGALSPTQPYIHSPKDVHNKEAPLYSVNNHTCLFPAIMWHIMETPANGCEVHSSLETTVPLLMAGAPSLPTLHLRLELTTMFL